jgi:hypothetical protein
LVAHQKFFTQNSRLFWLAALKKSRLFWYFRPFMMQSLDGEINLAVHSNTLKQAVTLLNQAGICKSGRPRHS